MAWRVRVLAECGWRDRGIHVQALADRRTRVRDRRGPRAAVPSMATRRQARPRARGIQPGQRRSARMTRRQRLRRDARRAGSAAARGIGAAPHGRASSSSPTPQQPRRTGRPTRLAKHGQRAGALKTHRRDDIVPLRRDDCAHSGKQVEDVLCTVFKAPTMTKPLLQNLNGLSYTQDGI